MKPDSMNTKPPNNSRLVVSIFMLIGFVTILVTGLLSYGLRYSSSLSAIHTIFGIVFVGFGIFHLRNNFRSVTMYLKQKRGRRWLKIALLLVPVAIVGVLLGLPPFKNIIDIGYALKELRPIDRQITETLSTRYDLNGRPLLIDVKAGDHYSGPGPVVLGVQITTIPQMAIWIEDTNGNYVETLYVTKKGATGTYIGELFSDQEVRRPEALPHWSHARAIQSEDGLFVPSKAKPLVDAVTGATPLASYELSTQFASELDTIVVKMEVNRSFDYNEHYHQNAFPDDPIYSGSGNTAQPSLIYAATIDFAETNKFTFLELIGRGHHSGAHGDIIAELNGITTAKELVHRVIVERQDI